jgi:hypothetical protein
MTNLKPILKLVSNFGLKRIIYNFEYFDVYIFNRQLEPL